MPGFKTHLLDTVVIDDTVIVNVHIDWFLENINIYTELKLPIYSTFKVKKQNNVDSIIPFKQIKFDNIPFIYKCTIGEPMLLSIKAKIENTINSDSSLA